MIAFKTRGGLDSNVLLLHTLSVITKLPVISLQVHIFDKKIAILGKFTQ